ncbi:hypothetical protein F4780DRAFT_783789 [Xylariomycetidae sp. FL0641]|nr:hypothetical protein F4780DRAFT_783789 [Xylariomycetidae sp. FL0641]
MAHHAQAAIFSPSVARAAASTAQDWAYVDGWLARLHGPARSPPPPPAFERNAQTLAALLALASANEAADEAREALARAEAAALEEVSRAHEADLLAATRRNAGKQQQKQEQEQEQEQVVHGAAVAADLETALDAALTREGRTALDALADVAGALGTTTTTTTAPAPLLPSAASLGHAFAALQGEAHSLSLQSARVDVLRGYLAAETARLRGGLLAALRDPAGEWAPRAGTAVDNLALQRGARDAAARLPDLRRAVEALERAVGVPPLAVEDVRRDEEAYEALRARKRDLDARVAAFAGLPPDVEAARRELERLRGELREATERRDADFERLVERESPVKVRRRP